MKPLRGKRVEPLSPCAGFNSAAGRVLADADPMDGSVGLAVAAGRTSRAGSATTGWEEVSSPLGR